MTLVDYVTTLRRSWRVIVAVMVLGAVLGYAYASSKPFAYRATSTVLVSADRAGSASDLVQGSTFVENLVTSYGLMASSELVLQPVIDELDLTETPRQLARALTVDTPLNTVLININVVRGDPEQAQEIANAVADELATAVSEVSPVVEGEPSVRVTTIQSASEPQFPIAPNVRRTTALGGALGLVLGVALAFLRRMLGGRVNDANDVALVTSTPVVGEIVEAKRGTSLPAAVRQNPRSPEAESLRGLAANLHYLTYDGGLRSMVVTSASPGEAKSNVASALALILAEGMGRVLLVDADLRSPSVDALTGLDNTIGLSSVLVGDYDLASAVQPWSPGVDVLTSGPVPPNPGQLLNSEGLRAVLGELTGKYDLVIIDAGPLRLVSDGVWLGHLVDRVLVVAQYGRTRTRMLAEAFESLAAGGVTASGVVISRIKRKRGGYGYGSDYVSPGSARRGRLGRRRPARPVSAPGAGLPPRAEAGVPSGVPTRGDR